MVGAVANSAVALRGLLAAPALAAAGDAKGPLVADGVGDTAGWGIAGTRVAAGLAAPGAADPGEMGLSAASVPGREGEAAGGKPGLPGIPGAGPPIHIRVLAGEAGLFAPGGLPGTDAAVTIARPQAWHTITGRVAPGLVTGSGAWQYGQFDGVIWQAKPVGVEAMERPSVPGPELASLPGLVSTSGPGPASLPGQASGPRLRLGLAPGPELVRRLCAVPVAAAVAAARSARRPRERCQSAYRASRRPHRP